ncbi:lambda family phage tail tape measure protein [Azorhizobium sp. AG788]|uniref:phage tail length tape measure family protein n=1 Tax=Azorhizobium sp. AG788 TaxID=2183897 RepID=UPI00105F17BB|nr:phage tail length tape measure family protein [Azorhizobium sp. AG788]TDT94551.1 lambda family phage tail tape measure protein [Azorhizobium sp. AG788]
MPTLETIARLQTEMVSTGADKVAADIRKVEAAQDAAASSGEALATVTDTVARRQLSGATALERVRKAVDDEYRAQQRLVQTQQVLDRNLQQGNLTQEEHARLLSLAATRYTVAKQANDNFSSSAASGSKLAAHEVQNLTFQLNDAATMLASGSSPFQVMATQGGQVYQVLSGAQGGLVGGLKGLGGTIAGLITPARLLGAGLVAGAALGVSAWSSYTAATKEFSRALEGTGKSTQASAADLERFAEQGSRAASVSLSDARSMTVAFAQTGKIGTSNFAGLVSVTKSFARVMGTELEPAAADLAKAFADPAQGAQDLDRKLNFLDQTTLDYIRTLADTNRKSEAQALLLRKLSEGLPTPTERLTLLGRAWQSVATFADQAYVAMGRALASATQGPSLDEQIAAAEKRLRDAQRTLAGPRGRASGVAATNAAAAQAELDRYRTQKAADEAKAKAAGDGEAVKEATATARARNPQFAQLQDLIKQQGTLRAAMDKPGADADLLMQALEGVRNQIDAITDADGKLAPVAEQLRRRRELELKVINATTDASRIAARQALAEFDAKAQGAGDATAKAQAENTALTEQAQLYAQLSAAARQRLATADEGILAARNEVELIGRTASEQALLNANYQAEADLRRQAAQTGIAVDQRELALLKQKSVELAQTIELRQRTQLRSEMDFSLRQLGRTDQEQQVASTLRGYGLAENLDSADAAMVRMTLRMQEFKATAKDAMGGFIDDLVNGTSATEAMSNALKRLASQLASKALDSALSSIFPSGNGGGLGGLLGMFSGSSAWSGANLTGLPLGFATGGFTGAGGKYEPAGVVHRGEYVFSADATSRLGVGRLESLHRLGRGYADGGYVGAAAYMAPWAAQQANVPMPAVTIGGPTITIQGNADSAALEQMRAELEAYKKQMPALVGQVWDTLQRKKRS